MTVRLACKRSSYTTAYDNPAIAGSEALLWIYYYLALHHSHRTSPSPDYPQSLDLINLAIKQDPTNPDAFIAKAHVLKRAGDLEAAVREMEKARALDKSDRYISCKVGKYLMRLGEVEKAEQVLGLFTKVSLGLTADGASDTKMTHSRSIL